MVGAVSPEVVPPGGSADIEAISATIEGAAPTAPNASFVKPPLLPTHSSVKKDAATYGVKYKPPKQFSFAVPRQAKATHVKWLKALGRIGWVAKGVIYALIGGLACHNAVGDRDSNASPQGAFVLIGTANGGKGLLVVLAVAILTYSTWRYWEGFVGQGYDQNFGKWKNFFKFRLSPMVSGSVYVAYDILVIEVIPRDNQDQQRWARSDSWPNSWHDTDIGKTGLVLIGIAFLAAVVVQLEQFVTKSFHNTIRDEFPYMPKRFWKAFRIFVLTCGHIGVLGRAGIFMFAAILFFRTIRAKNDYKQSAFGAAFAQLQNTKAGKAALFIMGFFVVTYGLFAVLNLYARYFPTPPPSRVPKSMQRLNANNPEGNSNPDGTDMLPAYAPGDSGFHPMRGPSTRNLQPGSGSRPGTPKVVGFSPMHDAVNSRKALNTAPLSADVAAPNRDVEMGNAPAPIDPPAAHQF